MLKNIVTNSPKPHDINSLGSGGGQSILLYKTMKYRVTRLHNADTFTKNIFYNQGNSYGNDITKILKIKGENNMSKFSQQTKDAYN